MASIRRNAKQDTGKNQDAETPETNEEIEVTADDEPNFDDLMAGFSNDNAESETSEMTDTAVSDSTNDDVMDGEVISDTADATNDAPEGDAKESALSDAAKEIADKATGHTVQMLEISSLPATVPHISGNLTTLNAIGDQIKAAIKEWEVRTGGTDAAVKDGISNLTEADDADVSEGAVKPFALREELAAAKAKIAELEEFIEFSEPKLYAAVEAKLAASGEVIWSQATQDEKRQYITDMYAGYVAMHKATESFIESQRNHKSSDNVGTIDQYHTKLDKPFKRATTSTSSGVRKTSGAPRNVSVSEAQVSYDGGVTWARAAGKLVADGPELSNPTFLAAELARISNESGSDLKARLYSEWYGDNGSADGTPLPSEDVKDVSEFDFTYIGKDGVHKSAKVRLTKKGATIEA